MERESEIEIGDIRNRIPKIERARIAEVYSRSVTEDRLNVPLPDDLHGEWVLVNELEIARKKALGFVIDDQYATKVAMHNDGTGKPIIGDVVHMITTKENKKIIDDIAKEAYVEMHGTREQKKGQKEERDFAAATGATEIKATEVKSKADRVTGKEIIESLPQS